MIAWLRYFAPATLALAISMTAMAATETFETREELQESYLHYRQNRQSPFATAPLTHITPSRGKLTIGLSGDLFDLAIVPKQSRAKDVTPQATHQLSVAGSTIAPLLSYSAKNYALGVTGEQGKRDIHYLRYFETGTSYEKQDSAAEWSGAGLYGYLLMPQSLLPRVVQLTVMAGSTFLKVEHRTNGRLLSQGAAELYRTYGYPVRRNELGITADLKLGRRFSLIVWYNYLTHKAGKEEVVAADPGVDPASDSFDDTWDQSLALDQELLWQDQLRHRMGLDIAYRLGKFEAHLGGVLGYLIARGTTPQHIADNTFFLSFAVSTANR